MDEEQSRLLSLRLELTFFALAFLDLLALPRASPLALLISLRPSSRLNLVLVASRLLPAMSALLLLVMNILPLMISSVLMMPGPNGNPFPEGNTLLVTAHPDDEVMFFSTAIQALTAQPKGELWALCLSNGASQLGRAAWSAVVRRVVGWQSG